MNCLMTIMYKDYKAKISVSFLHNIYKVDKQAKE